MHMGYFTDFIFQLLVWEKSFESLLFVNDIVTTGVQVFFWCFSVVHVNTLVCELIGQEQRDVIGWIWVK